METEEDTRRMIALTMAASIPARLAVQHFPTLARLWGKGDERKAGMLLAVWFAGVTFPFAMRSNPGTTDPRAVIDAWKSTAGHWLDDPTWAVDGLAEHYLQDLELFKAGGFLGYYPSLLVVMSAIALGAKWENVTFPVEHEMGIREILIEPMFEPHEFDPETAIFMVSVLNQAVDAIPGFIESLVEDSR